MSLQCNRELACRFAGCLLSMNPLGTVDDEVRDVSGEMASAINGNLQSSIAVDACISVLTVVHTPSHKTRVSASGARDKIAFSFPDTNLLISTLAREGSTATWSSIAA